ncbi:MAG: hypothetical protein ACRC2S_16310 [Waterburya sp.]
MINTAVTEQLREYPMLIHQLESLYFDDLKDRRELEDRINLFNAELELEIANDSSLRNEQMRKAQKVISQKCSSEYQEMVEALETLEGRISRSLLLLECRKREFSVLKLEQKMAIARLQEVVI